MFLAHDELLWKMILQNEFMYVYVFLKGFLKMSLTKR